MKLHTAAYNVVDCFFLFLWVKKVLLARIKPLPDTAVICSVNGFYLLTDDTCKNFLLTGAFNKNIFQFLRRRFFWYYCCPELASNKRQNPLFNYSFFSFVLKPMV